MLEGLYSYYYKDPLSLRERDFMDCVLQSFAYALNINKQYIIDKLGHDGTEVIDPTLSPPYNVRGFSCHELIDFALGMGYATVHLPKHNYVLNHSMKQPYIIDDYDYVKYRLNEDRYCLYNNTHMIGVRYRNVLDPMNQIKSIKDIEDGLFDYQGIFIIRSIAK